MTRKQKSEQNYAETVAFLRENKVYFTEPNPGHIKIGPINYWPARGKIHIDREPACHPERGLHALEAVLRERGHLRSGPNTLSTQPRDPTPTMPTLSVGLDPDIPDDDAD